MRCKGLVAVGLAFVGAVGLEMLVGCPITPKEQSWEGTWVLQGTWFLEGSRQEYAGTLVIEKVTERSFHYSLQTLHFTNNSVYTGDLEGEAKIVGRWASSIVGNAHDKGSQCHVYFNKKGDTTLKIETTNGDCFPYRGLRAFFEGAYVKNKVSLHGGG